MNIGVKNRKMGKKAVLLFYAGIIKGQMPGFMEGR